MRAAIVLLGAVAWAAEPPTPGVLTERVPVEADSSTSYAVYVPSAYRASRLWPVVYCFDPGARGRVPVELMREAAEKYGYVVVGLNNSRNGPYAPNLAAADATIKDSSARLRLDSRRVYTAGFSGGARMAAYIGYLGMPLAGVLISGGGFPQTPVGSQVPFDLFAAAGTEDFNLLEVRGIVNIVARAKKPHRFAVFEGSHQWADAATMREAIEWFELRAMTGGRRTRDDALIAELWTRRVERVERVAGLLARQGELAALVRDFESLRDVGPQKRALEDLEKSKEFKEARRAQEKLEERERLIVDRLSALGGADGESQWRDEVARFRKMSAAGSDSDERRLARRLLGGQAVGAIEASRAAMQEKRYGEAARLLRRAVLLRPEAAGLHYELARALALAGDRQPALNELRAAVEAGFEDRARLAADPAFDRLRGDEAFRELLARIQ